MAFDLDDDYACRRSIVDSLFISTADDNYVAARWAAAHGLDVDFFWLGVHAVEKYLKAALLLNGQSAKGYGHDIVRLYNDVQPLAPELLPSVLTRPLELTVDWSDEPTKSFIERLLRNGHADNRYLVSGYFRLEDDTFKLDQVAFAVRRLCQPLEAKREGVPDESIRQRMLKDHPSSARLGSHLEKIMEGKRGKELQHAALNFNFPFASFAPEGFEHTFMRYGFSGANPVLVRRILDPLRAKDPVRTAQADRTWRWVRGHIRLPPELIDAYEKERCKLRRSKDGRHPTAAASLQQNEKGRGD